MYNVFYMVELVKIYKSSQYNTCSYNNTLVVVVDRGLKRNRTF